jgi:hypothetical protein
LEECNEKILKRWMYCINALDLALNSQWSVYIPDPIYVILNDARHDLEYLLAYYEDESFETKSGHS